MDVGNLPRDWVRWDVDPIEPGSRRTAEELMYGRGRLSAAMVSKRIAEQAPGSPLRRKFFTAAVRAGFALTNRLEYDKAMRGYWDDCELRYPEGGGVGLTTHAVGHAEVRMFLEQFDGAFERRSYFPREIVDPGGARVGGRVTTAARGLLSGLEISDVLWFAWRFDAGKVRHQVVSSDRAFVFRALGAE